MAQPTQIQVDAQSALGFIQAILPVLEAAIPAVGAAAGPIGLGVSVIPVLTTLLSQIQTGELISIADQQALYDRCSNLLTRFQGPEWIPSNKAT